MALNFEKMRKDKAAKEAARGGNWQNIEQGDTKLYIGGACRPEDEVNYIEVIVHYGVGKENSMVPCLDDKNYIIHDKRVAEHLAARESGTTLQKRMECPVCAEFLKLKNGDADDKKQSESIKRNTRYLFNSVLYGSRKAETGEWNVPDEQKVATLMVGISVWEGILAVFFEEGDVTDVDKAVLFKINKNGSGMKTKYKVSVDTETIRRPLALTKAVKRSLNEAMEPGKEGDLYKVGADMIKTPQEVEALLEGTELADDDVGDDVKKACFGLDYTKDDECKECPWRGPCSDKLGKKLFPGHELAEGDHGYVPPAKSKAAARAEAEAKTAASNANRGRSMPEPEEDEKAPEEEPKPSKSSKTSKAAQEDPDLDALERELAAKSKKK